ncbi:hypothetical protein [uncultured Sphingomonas sp.]|uniref:hypothetical protein n=1 Tax=uncultured Sphingomonas sp. TaxID=158754 RepID=UPI0025D91B96|nr:hypothetical protein [uncultured Sphingomonas sp.]
MSKHQEVAAAVKELVKRALPVAKVIGMDLDEAKPTSIGELGQAIVRSGDAGEPEIDLSPPTWWWERTFPIELAARNEPSRSAQEVLAEMAMKVGVEISSDPYLGGLCVWLDATAPTDGEVDERGAAPIAWCDFGIVASYSTTSPLG